jgi:DHA3 family tetracycline resistance protein-like MFS transporter
LAGWFGLISAATLALSAFSAEIVRRRLDTNNPRAVTRSLGFLTAVIVLALAAFAWTESLPLALGAIMTIQVMRHTIDPIYTAWMNQRIDSRVRATVLSLGGQVDALGQIAGGPLVGGIGGLWGLRFALSASALLLTPALALLGRVKEEHIEV